MLWRNEEQYADYTAGRAMLHAMVRNADELDALDDEGCLRLVVAVLRQAAEDHASALRRLPEPAAVRLKKETEAFFGSEYCRLLTGMNGKRLMKLIEKELEEE